MLLGPALRPYLDSLDLVQSVHRSLLLGLRQEKYDISSPDQIIALAVTLVLFPLFLMLFRRKPDVLPLDEDAEIAALDQQGAAENSSIIGPRMKPKSMGASQPILVNK